MQLPVPAVQFVVATVQLTVATVQQRYVTGCNKGLQPRIWGTPCNSAGEALEALLSKVDRKMEKHEPHRLRCLVRGDTAPDAPHAVVSIVHQIYGLFRDGEPMSSLFAKSSMAWKAWCERQGARYILWDAEMVESLVRKYVWP